MYQKRLNLLYRKITSPQFQRSVFHAKKTACTGEASHNPARHGASHDGQGGEALRCALRLVACGVGEAKHRIGGVA